MYIQCTCINIWIWIIECFTTTFLHTHSWLSWVDEDDVWGWGWLEKNTRSHIEMRSEAPGLWASKGLDSAWFPTPSEILIHKLQYYGVRETSLNWLSSYLTKRGQYAMYNGSKSHNKCITCGVPQGSILGPLLFLVYMNDVPFWTIQKLYYLMMTQKYLQHQITLFMCKTK